MVKKLIETSDTDQSIVFYLSGYDDCDDFMKIYDIIKSRLTPDDIRCAGMTDMCGYFIKDGIRVDLEFDTMTGNEIIYRNTGHPHDLEKVRGWVQLIWNILTQS